mmetsp:Transcript_7481/g.17731  ORF Transcript_7481/g.17731 Transcript_7481/m.17731 type:complete len:254 (-) Transcript_7481:233-994(-)
MHHLGVCRCECVFVDVGLNDGSTLLAWPRLASTSTKMTTGTLRRDRRVPGLRWHLRQKPETRARLKRCLANAKANACYYGFEANAHFTPQLEILERRQCRNGYRVKLFTSTAIATHDGAMRLAVDQSVGHLGSGIEACHAEHASLPATPAASSAAAMVRAVDAARFLASLAAPEYTGLMAAKLDREGCEFSVVSHILPVLCAAPRGRAELLAIEWHPVGDAANYSGAPEQHPAVQLSHQLEAPGCNIVSLAWV